MKAMFLNDFKADLNNTINTAIICTSEYDLLRPFKVNRYGGFENQLAYTTKEEIISFRKHVDEIKNSMISFGEKRGFPQGLFDPREPIVVFHINGRYYIGDGQHRTAAAKELGIPVYILIIESNFGVYDESTNTMRMDANDEEFACEYFLRMNKEMQMRWSAASKISTEARANNYMAQYICDICNKKKYFKSTTLNDRMTFEYKKVNKRTKKEEIVSAKATEYYKIVQPTLGEINEMKEHINEYVSAMEKIAMAFYNNEKFGKKKESTKENWLTNTFNNKYLGFAILWIMKNREKAKSKGFLNWDYVVKRIIEQNIIRENNHYNPNLFLQKFGVCVGDNDELSI